MKWFANWKTAKKLAFGFGVTVVLAVAVGITAINKMSQMNSRTDAIVSDALAGTAAMGSVIDDTLRFRLQTVRALLTANSAERVAMEAKIRDRGNKVAEDFARYAKSATEADDRANLQKVKDGWNTYLADHEKLMALLERNDMKGATALTNGKSLDDYNRMAEHIQDMVAWNTKNGARLSQEAASSYSTGRTTVIGLLLLAAALGIVLAVLVTRAIVPPLNRMAAVAEHLAVGDVNQDVAVHSEDEIGKLAESFRSMIAYQKEMSETAGAMAVGDISRSVHPKSEKDLLGTAFHRMVAYQQEMSSVAESIASSDLTRTVRPMSDKDALGLAFGRMVTQLSQLIAQARVASNSIAAAAREVSVGNEDLSQRTSEQASSLEETASSMEQMSVTVKQNAENTRQANQLATQARDVAEKGGEVVQDAVSSMEEISQSSRRITEIVAVIDEIAFQTNLLALNAAVEAARVGEQGRGFAVVAAEVRSLAGRSATAAKEIKALVQDSGQKVQEGSELVHQSGQRLSEIVTAVKKVADIVAEISAASQEQAEGIEQVNKAVMQMDQITQQNAALVEEASAASQSASSQAETLQSVVATFRLDPSYLESVERTSAQDRLMGAGSERSALQATGTDGRPPRRSSRQRSEPKLRVLRDDGDFEQF